MAYTNQSSDVPWLTPRHSDTTAMHKSDPERMNNPTGLCATLSFLKPKKATGKLPPGKAFFCWRWWLPTVRESVWLALRKVTVDIQREAATSKIDQNRSNSTTSIVEVQGLNTRGKCNGKTLVSNAIGKTFVVLCCNQQRNSGRLGPLPLQLLLLTPKLTI